MGESFGAKLLNIGKLHANDTSFEGHKLNGQKLTKFPNTWDIKGANAYIENGANIGSRITATRVAAGLVLAGPIGGIIGGLAKKDRNKIYVLIETTNNEVVSIETKAKDEAKARAFINKVNAAAKL